MHALIHLLISAVEISIAVVRKRTSPATTLEGTHRQILKLVSGVVHSPAAEIPKEALGV